MRSFYDILEVSACASADEVKRAYFDYLRRIHPDKSAALGEGEETVAFATYIWRTLKVSLMSKTSRRESSSYDEHFILV